MNCEGCGKQLPENVKFCDACGHPVNQKQEEKEIICPGCGTTLPVDAKFCDVCGAAMGSSSAVSDVAADVASGSEETVAPDKMTADDAQTASAAHESDMKDAVDDAAGATEQRSEKPASSESSRTETPLKPPSAKTDFTSTQICSKCGASVPASSKFCEKCGSRVTDDLVRGASVDSHTQDTNVPTGSVRSFEQPAANNSGYGSCPSCGARLIPSSKFCEKCGARVGAGPSAQPYTPASSPPPPVQAAPAAQPKRSAARLITGLVLLVVGAAGIVLALWANKTLGSASAMIPQFAEHGESALRNLGLWQLALPVAGVMAVNGLVLLISGLKKTTGRRKTGGVVVLEIVCAAAACAGVFGMIFLNSSTPTGTWEIESLPELMDGSIPKTTAAALWIGDPPQNEASTYYLSQNGRDLEETSGWRWQQAYGLATNWIWLFDGSAPDNSIPLATVHVRPNGNASILEFSVGSVFTGDEVRYAKISANDWNALIEQVRGS